MIERDKEYYNQKISELYAVIENQEKIIRDLQELKQELQDRLDYEINFHIMSDKNYCKTIKNLSNKIDKTIEYIENNTMYFDSEYARDFGELCTIPGAGDTRTHCVIGDKQLLEILKGGNNE